MSSKRQKKRKPSEMFDLDRILATVKSNESNIDNIREHMKALRDVDLQYILTEKVKLTEEEALTLASFQAGVQGISFLCFFVVNVCQTCNNYYLKHEIC